MTFDANIVIGYLAGDRRIISLISDLIRDRKILFLPSVAETEILSFSQWTPEERKTTEQFLEENFTSISFDRIVARIAAEIRRDSKIKFPDAAIAACALYTKTPLVTRNQRDFKHIAGLDILAI